MKGVSKSFKRVCPNAPLLKLNLTPMCLKYFQQEAKIAIHLDLKTSFPISFFISTLDETGGYLKHSFTKLKMILILKDN